MASGHTEGWYVTPTAGREEFLRGGVAPDPRVDGDELWLFDSRDLAIQSAELTVAESSYIPTEHGSADIWHVNLSGLATEHYPHIIDAENLEFVGAIEPDRLSLERTL